MPMRSSFQRSAPAGKEVSKFCQTKYRCVKKVELGQRGCTACGRGGVALTTMAVTGLAAGMQLRRHRCVEFSDHASPRLHLCSLLTVGWDLRKDTYQRRLENYCSHEETPWDEIVHRIKEIERLQKESGTSRPSRNWNSVVLMKGTQARVRAACHPLLWRECCLINTVCAANRL